MNKLTLILLACLVSATAPAKDEPKPATTPAPPPPATILLREIRYDGRLSDDEARFTVDVQADAAGKGECSVPLFAGDVAVLPGKLPDALKIVREGDRYLLFTTHAGQFKFRLELVAKIQRAEPWNRISFTGPAATIASVTAQAAGAGMEVQLLNGTLLESVRTNGLSRVKGFLGADQTVALRWQGRIAEVSRQALLTVNSTIDARITPGVIRYASRFHYEIVQGSAARLTLALPSTEALTRLVGEQIRDWHTIVEGDRQTLAIEFIKPIEKTYDLTLFSEQTVEGGSAAVPLRPPQSLEVERESGALTLAAEDTLVEIESLAGLRQVNATGDALAAYRFNARPFALALKLKRIEPVITAADRVSARLEETRFVISHRLSLNVEKAGIYAVELVPQPGFAVAEVRGDGVEDWKTVEGGAAEHKVVRVNFASRVLGLRHLDVQLEQSQKTFPDQIAVAPLRVTGAARETARIGAAAAPGIRLKTGELSGLREIPVRSLQSGTGFQSGTDFQPVSNASADNQTTGRMPVPPSDELLAYTADQPDWKLALTSERLAARIAADVFNLVTIGDGIVGGSATIRYGLVNQGVQEFRVRIPAHWKNVEFTGPNIRRKEAGRESAAAGRGPAGTNSVVWTIGLQDKVWGGYTLVVTYDFPFDAKAAPGREAGATLSIGGAHPLDAERETGSIAVTTAASLQLGARTATEALRRLDETELSAADRSLITRAVVLAYQYTGDQYDLAVDVKRFNEEPVLEAVADRTQITSVLTEAGEMLTQASFMVKNNQKQFQSFTLPRGAQLWNCYVNGRPARPERDAEKVLVPLPRDANRDQAFAVDIMYAQTNQALASRWLRTITLAAPSTDVPNTYAEWQVFVPQSLRLSGFGGSMTVARGTTYELLDAWERFLAFYGQVLREAGSAVVVIGILAVLVIALVISAVRRGWSGIVTVLGVFAILAVLGAMLLPALARAKAKAHRVSSVNNLKQIGVAAQLFAGGNGDRLPVSFEEMRDELGSDRVTYDPESGQRYVYLGGGMSLENLKPESVLAYSPIVNNHCNVLLADGSVQQISAVQFGEMSQRGLVQPATPADIARARQRAAVMNSQFVQPAEAVAAATPPLRPGAPLVAGARALRIELPQTGQPFLFNKVLNVGNDPLSIRARVMSLRTFQAIQMTWQTAAFLLGLLVWWWQWSRYGGTRRNTFVLALALALVLGSVGSLLIQWRALHDLLIVGFPVVTLALMALLVWKYWPRGGRAESIATPVPEPPQPESGLPPVVAAIALVFTLSLTAAAATEPAVQNPSSEVDAASIVSATYSGTVNDRVAALDVALQFSSAKARRTIPLFGPDVAVQQFSVKRGDARLIRSGDGLAVRLGGRGDVTLQIKMLVKVAGDVTKRQLAFNIPAALSSQVSVVLDQAEADVDFPTAISFRRAPDQEKTRVEAVIGSADHVELLWTPRVKRAAEVAATVFCQNNSLVHFGGGVVGVRAVMDYQITQGELRQARVRLPAGQRLLRVEGASIRTWELKNDGGAPVLVVELLKGISPDWRLTVETEQPLEGLPASVAVEVPHALEVKRETGLVALRNAEELGLSVESVSDLQRVDVEEFARAERTRGESPKTSDAPSDADEAGGWFSVFRSTKPEFALRVRVEAVQPQIEAVVRNHTRIGTDQITLSAAIQYTIRRAGVFALSVALPAGYRVERVSGSNILQWTERAEGAASPRTEAESRSRVLEISLKERTSGTYVLEVELAQNFRELPRSLGIVGVHPLNAEKLTGYVAVSAESGVTVKTGAFDGLTEIPAVSLPDYAKLAGAGGVLAFKFIAAAPQNVSGWQLTVATEAVGAWVRAEVVNTITVGETLLSGRALVRFDIANAPSKELRLRIPAAFRNVEITGSNIRTREPISGGTNSTGVANPTTDSLWRVELQSKTRGFYTLAVTWEQPRSKTNTVELAGVSADGVERETGLLAIIARAPLQVTEVNAAELQRVDTADFPDWAGRPDDATTLAYRYVRPGYQLVVDARRFGEADVLRALVDHARLTTVVADDGQMMTEMSLTVRNNGRQFLEIELPPGATVWSAFVAGQPVRPSRNLEKLLVPIQPSSVNEEAISVDLTYVSAKPFPRKRGQVGFESPRFNVPLKNARWELFLPPDYNYDDFRGTMIREVAAAPESATSFSLSDYTRMEKRNLETWQAEVKRDVTEAQRQLAGGNVREATANFSKVRGNAGGRFNYGDAEVKKLEKDLQSAQASNLINAQNEFAARNVGQIALQANAPAQGQQFRYDNEAAGQQWVKLQQAQEIVAAQVQPLHVNLPLRGLRQAFTQVLQTEIGKPMTIRLLAVSTRAVSWPMRLGVGCVVFLLLWGIVVAVVRVIPKRTQS